MKFLTFKFLIILLYLLSSSGSYAIQDPKIKNLFIHKNQKKLENINFKNIQNETVYLNNFKNSLVLINFWATWCAPCKDEMPSLDKLQAKDGIFIFPINMEEKNLQNTNQFYKDLNIENLKIYFDDGLKLVKVFALRGVPTTVILNKNKEMIARISGSIDFEDEKFISWLNSIK